MNAVHQPDPPEISTRSDQAIETTAGTPPEGPRSLVKTDKALADVAALGGTAREAADRLKRRGAMQPETG